MILKYLGSVRSANDYENRVVGIAWSPNNLKLAVALADRSIHLYDDTGAKRDKFQTKPVDSKHGKKSYIIKAIAFSPDSTKIAVGQTDDIVYIYKIGEDWGEKKVICNKFSQTSSVTCMVWSSEGPIVIGLADGKIRAATTKSRKAQTLYVGDAMTIALAMNTKGTGFLSSHADGSINRYYMKTDGNAETWGKLIIHPVPAYALSWTHHHIIAGGCDKKLVFYDTHGKSTKTFDYSRDPNDKELSSACCSPSGQSLAIGSWNKLRLYDWIPKRSTWEETNTRELPNIYTVTSMCWRKDGSKLVIGGLCGTVEHFETIIKRSTIRGNHEIIHVGPSQIVVRSLKPPNTSTIVNTQTGNEIEDVRVVGRQEAHVVARTSTSLLLADLLQNRLSEIPWISKITNEKFYFDYPNVCLIFHSGELTCVEYGRNEILCSVRTETTDPKIISVCSNDSQISGSNWDKLLAYPLDPRTIRIVNCTTGETLSIVGHDAKVDWIELSDTGRKLLSRDKRGRLWLSDDKGLKILLSTGTNYASWVPGSDVAVAQIEQTVAVWYNIEAPETPTHIPIRGNVVKVVRENGQTFIVADDSGSTVNHPLDVDLIEFGTALRNNDYGRVVLFLEEFGDRPQTEAMWENVAKNAMSKRKLVIAARCYAALGDVACSNFLKKIVENDANYAMETGNPSTANPESWAKLAILNGELKTAEAIYLEQNELDKALDMYQKYWHWEDALALAENRGWSGLNVLRDKHLSWLLESGQIARAAAIIESDNPRRAIKLFIQARRAGRAGRLLLANEQLLEDPAIVNDVVDILISTDIMELAGEIMEKTSNYPKAIEYYAKAGIYSRALDLARSMEPNSVVTLEKDWGHHLVKCGQYDAAINHFIEAGETSGALDAAVNARQWRKALQIVQVIENDDKDVKQQCRKLADYYASVGDGNTAETLFLRAGDARKAVEVHVKSGNWTRAHDVAVEFMNVDEAREILSGHADRLMRAGDLRHAEALLVATGQHDAAIAMYRKAGSRSDMIRLVTEHRPDLLKTTHGHLARELEAAGKAREAEEHFLAAEDWRGAVAAYRTANMWEDALRVAKKASGDKAGQQVALFWARTMAPELSARLLKRLNYFDGCLQLACEAGIFDWAIEVVKYGTSEQQRDVYYKHAMALEDEGKFNDAEKEFIRAGKAFEAVQMYIHTRDWEAAEEVAQSVNQEAVAQVLIARAAEAASEQNYAQTESLLLRAHKPDMIVEHYKKAGMWSDAMRVCREYLPSQEAALRRELSQKTSGMDAGDSLAEARRWLAVGETRTALDILMVDPDAPKSVLVQAADVLINQADQQTAMQVGGDLGLRLIDVGEHGLAAQVYLQADKFKEAVNALTSIGDWTRAKRVVEELAPELESYLDDKYKDAMIKNGQMDRLVEIDADAALDIMARKGQWTQLFEAASAQNSEILHKYVAQRATQLLKSGSADQALQLYTQFGAPNVPQYYNLYCRLCEATLNATTHENDAENRYKRVAQLRTLLLKICEDEKFTSKSYDERMKKFLQIAHYSAMRLGCKNHSELDEISAKTSTSLLRYSDVLLADRCYYEAGTAKRKIGCNSEAFVFLNHFLDLEECIEDGDGGIVDVDDLRVTDFPLEVPLPERPSVSREEREEAREWVLAVSMDRRVEQGLPVDQRGVYVGSLNDHANNSSVMDECVITGYPIRGPVVRFEGSDRVADRNDWNKLTNAARQSNGESSINDIMVFIQQWCGNVSGYAFS